MNPNENPSNGLRDHEWSRSLNTLFDQAGNDQAVSDFMADYEHTIQQQYEQLPDAFRTAVELPTILQEIQSRFHHAIRQYPELRRLILNSRPKTASRRASAR